MVMIRVKLGAINNAMFMSSVAMHVVNTTLIHCWLYERFARSDLVQRNAHHSHAYVSVIS